MATTAPEPRKHILILGGSYAGLSTAHYLLKHAVPRLPRPDSYQVVLVSPSTEVLCRPACPRAMVSADLLPQDQLFVSIPELFAGYPAANFRFEHGSAVHLDHDKRTVLIQSAATQREESVEYHALVIATGASTPSPLLGLSRDADSGFLRRNWGTLREALPAAKNIVIAGGGPAGVETAGELGEYLNGRAGWLNCKMEKPKVRITVVTSATQILPALRPGIAAKAETFLAQVGVNVVKNTQVAAVTPENSGTADALVTPTKVALTDGNTLEADIYIPATGTSPNTGYIEKSLLGLDGRVENNRSTLRVDGAGPRVYAIGDVASYSRPAVHAILNAVPVLGANMKRDLLLASGSEAAVGADREYQEDTRETQMVPIGQSKGVGAAMGYQLPSWMVWLIKGRDYWLWTTGGLWSGKQWAKES
ncbi:uncharacterized protein N7459_001669 [Penicillium hispanicum]|uniref:uncharacterized protein n=1 Tax=Penicillium hispanicum TaxID=1080232 RepID=UPI00253F85FF|nr:uncharacterized protein N7459_001669 [Penicillium hispanicum]KAJ5595461.1 hypothetical protein N7459_001669 [Penicillium hispanicum]